MNLTMGAIVDTCVRMRPDGIAATLGREAYTFGQVDANGNRLAHVLTGLGVGQGDLVAWLAGPAMRTLDGFVATARIGAMFATINHTLPPVEIEATLSYLQPKLVVSDAEHAEACEQICHRLGLALAVFGAAAVPGVRLDAAIDSASAARPAAEVDDRLPHMVFLTSGSTGTPKGAVISQRASWLRSSPGGGTFCRGHAGGGGMVTGFPIFHYGGWHYVIEAWQNRVATHLVHRARAEEMLDAVAHWRASGLYAIPAVWERILEVPDRDFDLGSLVQADTGTSFTSESLLERIRRRVPHARTNVHYGSTEAGHMATRSHEDLLAHPGSVGRAATPGALWLSDEGEVLFSTPAMMEGYLRLPEQTAAALAGGVYHSGDVGYFDDEGFLYLTGRTKELIRSGGEWIWPVEVETALKDCAGVADVAVVGIPDPRWGDVVCAAVVPQPGHEAPDLAALRRHIADRLPSFKHPRMVAVVPEIPRTSATGQVRRAVLAAAIADRR